MCDYRELRPERSLAAYVACFWTRSTDARAADPRPLVLPDGCVDVVWLGQAAPEVAGPATGAVCPTLPPGQPIVGVRFRPGLAASVLGVPACELLDRQVPLRDLWGPEPSRVWARVGELATPETKLAAVEAALRDRLAEAGPADRLVCAAATRLAREPTASVHELGQSCGLSERQLRRRFADAVGYGPKTFQRIMRFRRWLRLAERPAGAGGLADLALAAGYADQAHLTREVRRLAGLPPIALLVGAGQGAATSDSFKTAAARVWEAGS